MNSDLIERIDAEIEKARGNVISDTIRFVNIKSVLGEPVKGAPFGIGPKMMLDEFYRTAKNDGFHVTDYGVGVISASMKNAPIDLGIWLHGDVVPEGDGWIYPPYDAREYKGCIIGRGATDNKGQLAAAYNLFKIFNKLGIDLKHNVAIFLGSDEESGKHDITGIEGNPDAKGFLNVASAPSLSLVPDSGFPVGYGGFGSLVIKVRSTEELSGFDFTAGGVDDPGLAVANLKGVQSVDTAPDGCEICEGGRALSAYTLPRHGTRPDPDGNMITVLANALSSLSFTSDSDKKILAVMRDLSLDIYGEWHPVSNKEDKFSRLIVYPKAVAMVDNRPEMTLNIRFPYAFTYDSIIEAISSYAKSRGYEVSHTKKIANAYLLDKDTDIVKVLTEIANTVCEMDKEPYILTGGTYAHDLPNAYVFGTDSNRPPEDFPKGHGGAHGVDEVVSVDRLLRMMRIYARALLTLDEMM